MNSFVIFNKGWDAALPLFWRVCSRVSRNCFCKHESCPCLLLMRCSTARIVRESSFAIVVCVFVLVQLPSIYILSFAASLLSIVWNTGTFVLSQGTEELAFKPEVCSRMIVAMSSSAMEILGFVLLVRFSLFFVERHSSVISTCV